MHAIFQLIYFEPSAKEDLSEQTIIMLHNLKSIKSHAHHLHVSTWKYAHNPLCPPFVSILTNFLPQAWMSINVHSSVLCFLLGKMIYPSSIEHLSPWTLLIDYYDRPLILAFFVFLSLPPFQYPGSLDQIQLRRAIAHTVLFLNMSFAREQLPSLAMWDPAYTSLFLSFYAFCSIIIP